MLIMSQMYMLMMIVQAPPQPLSICYSLDFNHTGRNHPKIEPNVWQHLTYLLIRMSMNPWYHKASILESTTRQINSTGQSFSTLYISEEGKPLNSSIKANQKTYIVVYAYSYNCDDASYSPVGNQACKRLQVTSMPMFLMLLVGLLMQKHLTTNLFLA